MSSAQLGYRWSFTNERKHYSQFIGVVNLICYAVILTKCKIYDSVSTQDLIKLTNY